MINRILLGYACAGLFLVSTVMAGPLPKENRLKRYPAQVSESQSIVQPEESQKVSEVRHSEPVGSFDYPELSVVPRASDRLKTEAEREENQRYFDYLPIQLSAAATLASGIVGMNPHDPAPAYIATGVGAGWLLLTTSMSLFYQPYRSSLQGLETVPRGTVRDQLTRERAAEVEIQRLSRLGTKLKWLSLVSNFGSSLLVLSAERRDKKPGFDYLDGMVLGSAILALTPLIFPFHWGDVADEQQDFKKRIYAPVAKATVFQDPVTRSLIPGLAISMRF